MRYRPAQTTTRMACKRPVLLLVLLISTWSAECCRKLFEASPEPWPPEWDLPVTLMSRGDLLARGGAMKSLGRDKLTRIRKRTSVGLDEEQLAMKLDTDAELFVDVPGDRLLHKCGGLVPPQPPKDNYTAPTDLPTGAASLTESEVFSLSSRPGAQKKILLDFNGHTTTGTDWNGNSSPTIVSPAWDRDGNPDAFSASELAEIKDMWRMVAEDYAPWNVDVTTKDPGDAALLGVGVRVIIGGDSEKMLKSTVGGLAWVGSFGSKNPCFVFPWQLFNNIKATAESASHEAGHTLGLLHHGTTQTAYYPGHGQWAPIMGYGSNKNITQWSKGKYDNANNPQNDLAVISQFLDVLPQKYGSNIATATALPTAGTVSGIISWTGQTDYFSFTADKAGPVALHASGPGFLTDKLGWSYPIGNLDMQLTLYDKTGAAIAASSPDGFSAEALGASLTVTLPSQGTYYVAITGSGSGDPSSTGYSNYGSLGQYTLKVGYESSGAGGNQLDDPMDCKGAWSGWSDCSKPCGTGIQYATYTVTDPGKNGGGPCSEKDGATNSRECNVQSCGSYTQPVDCQGAWSDWSECSKPCGTGTQSRTYRVTTPAQHGGSECGAADGENRSRECSLRSCDSNNPSPAQALTATVRLQRVSAGRSRYKCKATVTIKRSTDAKLANARVSGHWSCNRASAAFEQDVIGRSSAKGVAAFTSKRATDTSCAFTLTDVSLEGYAWGGSRKTSSIDW